MVVLLFHPRSDLFVFFFWGFFGVGCGSKGVFPRILSLTVSLSATSPPAVFLFLAVVSTFLGLLFCALRGETICFLGDK